MVSLMRPATAGNVLCAAILVLTAVVPFTADGASSNPTVTVVNTTANPVPVSGSITVGNSVVPVEVSNADPIPVSISQNPAAATVRGSWHGDFTSIKSQVIFTVPAGKRRVVTDVVVAQEQADALFTIPLVVLLSECGANDTRATLASWYMVPIQPNLIFQAIEHFTTGIVLGAGECFKVAPGSASSNAVTVTWFEENAS